MQKLSVKVIYVIMSILLLLNMTSIGFATEMTGTPAGIDTPNLYVQADNGPADAAVSNGLAEEMAETSAGIDAQNSIEAANIGFDQGMAEAFAGSDSVSNFHGLNYSLYSRIAVDFSNEKMDNKV